VPQPQLGWATAPVVVWPGENALLCAVNLAPADSRPIALQLELVEIGDPPTVLGSTEITLPPLDSGLHPPNPCVAVVISAATSTASASSPALVVGRVAVNPQPLPPAALTASLQVFGMNAHGDALYSECRNHQAGYAVAGLRFWISFGLWTCSGSRRRE
jgi:hypothetical protein